MPLLNALLIWAVLGQGATATPPQSPATENRADSSRDAGAILQARCFVCHGAGQQMNGLRLDRREDALRGSNSGPVIVPGKSGESKLIHMVSGTIEGKIMPPAGQKLTSGEIAVLRSWIDQGAQWPVSTGAKAEGTTDESTHWAFRSIRRPAIPEVKNRSWARNAIDNFVLARLEAEGIEPSPEASRSTLVRRLSLDLTGLPPTLEETAAFVADDSPGAYERLVERLLESPHYGEKWARHWLDLARYSDSDGYRQDDFRPHAWRYRRWVIEAFNQDMPFDRFTTEQIAGDVLPNSTVEQKVATGFHRNTPSNREGGTDFHQFRHEQVLNRINTVGTVWLGLTVGCAQCHDHKYDPLSHKEYYQLFAFMDNVEEVNIDAPLPGEMGPYLRAVESYRKARRDLLEQYRVPQLQPAWEAKLLEAMANPGKWQEWDKALGTVRVGDSHPVFAMGEKILRTPPEKRNEKEAWILTENFIRYSSQVYPEKVYKEELKFEELRKKLKELDDGFPALSQAQTIAVEREPHPSHIHLRGEFKQTGSVVEPGFPSFLHKAPKDPLPPRLTLARWLVSPDNPLTARVTVNRIWQELFGRGIVLTSENFGTQGEKPSHPALLDWLASEFRDGGWSVKQTVRKIVLSAAYRQMSLPRKDLKTRDPDNMLLARQTRFRLTAESLRDSALAVSGLLSPEVGGKSIRPPRPAGAKMSRGKWTESPGRDRYGRSLYVQYQRMSPHPFMTNFDMADAYSAVCRRTRSNTALQALNLLNDPAFFEAAQALAVRVLTEASRKPEERLDYAFRLCLARTPEPDEREWLATAIHRQEEILRVQPELANLTFPVSLPGVSPVEGAAWVGAGRVLLNLYEFMTRE